MNRRHRDCSEAQGARHDGFLPLEQYAAISDGASIALVGADGSVDWWCVPGVDSAPLFDRLLDAEHGGRFSVTPVDAFTVERRYLPGSNVVEHIFTTATGKARLTDSLNIGTSGPLPWSELARRIEGLEGSVDLQVDALAGRRLGLATSWRESGHSADVVHVEGIVAAVRSSDALVRIVANDRGLVASLKTQPGSRETIAVVAAMNGPLIVASIDEIDRRIDLSDESWREWSDALRIDGPYRPALERCALALKLLICSRSGSIAAAATTSLPERLGGDKNYDYRYAWVRDVAFTINALLHVGATQEAAAAFSWLVNTIQRNPPPIRTMYRLDGELSPPERDVPIPGYANSVPCRIGNRARDHLQLGIFADVLQTAALFVDKGHVLDLGTRAFLAKLADTCADIWRQPDSGIWELADVEQYTVSKLGCWSAMDRAAWLAREGYVDATRLPRWERERDRIRDWIDEHCWSEKLQAYTMYPGSGTLDASVLLAARAGFERRDRLRATCHAVARDLSSGPLVYRYSGAKREEGTFTACGFWLAEALALLDDLESAKKQMDGMLAACEINLGLLSEQIDAGTGAMLGNLPQALSHLALIGAATAIGDVQRKSGA